MSKRQSMANGGEQEWISEEGSHYRNPGGRW